MSGLDRSLGAAFGLLRAAVLVGLAVIVMQFVELDQEPWWQEARLRPYAERVAAAVKYYAELGTRYLQEQPVRPNPCGLGSTVCRGVSSVGRCNSCVDWSESSVMSPSISRSTTR